MTCENYNYADLNNLFVPENSTIISLVMPNIAKYANQIDVLNINSIINRVIMKYPAFTAYLKKIQESYPQIIKLGESNVEKVEPVVKIEPVVKVESAVCTTKESVIPAPK